MTEVAEAPGTQRAQELKRINHWINGAPVAGQSGRSGPVYNPAAGIQSGEVDFAVDLFRRREVELAGLNPRRRIVDGAAAPGLPRDGGSVDPVVDPLQLFCALRTWRFRNLGHRDPPSSIATLARGDRVRGPVPGPGRQTCPGTRSPDMSGDQVPGEVGSGHGRRTGSRYEAD